MRDASSRCSKAVRLFGIKERGEAYVLGTARPDAFHFIESELFPDYDIANRPRDRDAQGTFVMDPPGTRPR